MIEDVESSSENMVCKLAITVLIQNWQIQKWPEAALNA